MQSSIREARARVRAKSHLLKSIGSFVASSIFLIGLNLVISPSYMWAWWPVGFGAISICFKAIKIVISDRAAGWEKRELEREYGRLGYEFIDDENLELQDIHSRTNKPLYKASELV